MLGSAVVLAAGTMTAVARGRRALEASIEGRGSDLRSAWDCDLSLAETLAAVRRGCLPPRLDHGAPGKRPGLAPEALCFLVEALGAEALQAREGLTCA
jgi:hypothetical protein